MRKLSLKVLHRYQIQVLACYLVNQYWTRVDTLLRYVYKCYIVPPLLSPGFYPSYQGVLSISQRQFSPVPASF